MTKLEHHWTLFQLRLKYGLHWNKHAYLAHLLRNVLLSKYYRITGQNKFILRGIDFGITYACNYRCTHCYAEGLKQKGNKKIMEPEDYRRVADQAMAMGCVVFSIQGGEPLLRKDLNEVINAFYPKKNHVIMTTNGSLLNRERIKELQDIGMDTLYFSLDSGNAEDHDQFRKAEGSFDKIMENIDICEEYGMKVVINTTISNNNLYSDGLKKLFDFSKSRRIVLETIFARPLGNWKNHEDIMLSEKDIKYYYELRKDYPNVVRDLDNNYRMWGCPAVKEVLYITPYGDVCGCPYNHVTFGNVMEEPLEVIRQRGLSVPWYDHYHKECLTALEKDYMDTYLPLVAEKGLAKSNELVKKTRDKDLTIDRSPGKPGHLRY